eukprot:CFRG0455T1
MWRAFSHVLGTDVIPLTSEHLSMLLSEAGTYIDSIVAEAGEGKVIHASNDNVLSLCLVLERVLQDGVKANSIWKGLRTQDHTRKEDLSRIKSHPYTTTLNGKWRAWLVLQMEESMLHVSLYGLLSDSERLKLTYETTSRVRTKGVATLILSLLEKMDVVKVNLSEFSTVNFDLLSTFMEGKSIPKMPLLINPLTSKANLEHTVLRSWTKPVNLPTKVSQTNTGTDSVPDDFKNTSIPPKGDGIADKGVGTGENTATSEEVISTPMHTNIQTLHQFTATANADVHQSEETSSNITETIIPTMETDNPPIESPLSSVHSVHRNVNNSSTCTPTLSRTAPAAPTSRVDQVIQADDTQVNQVVHTDNKQPDTATGRGAADNALLPLLDLKQSSKTRRQAWVPMGRVNANKANSTNTSDIVPGDVVTGNVVAEKVQSTTVIKRRDKGKRRVNSGKRTPQISPAPSTSGFELEKSSHAVIHKTTQNDMVRKPEQQQDTDQRLEQDVVSVPADYDVSNLSNVNLIGDAAGAAVGVHALASDESVPTNSTREEAAKKSDANIQSGHSVTGEVKHQNVNEENGYALPTMISRTPKHIETQKAIPVDTEEIVTEMRNTSQMSVATTKEDKADNVLNPVMQIERNVSIGANMRSNVHIKSNLNSQSRDSVECSSPGRSMYSTIAVTETSSERTTLSQHTSSPEISLVAEPTLNEDLRCSKISKFNFQRKAHTADAGVDVVSASNPSDTDKPNPSSPTPEVKITPFSDECDQEASYDQAVAKRVRNTLLDFPYPLLTKLNTKKPYTTTFVEERDNKFPSKLALTSISTCTNKRNSNTGHALNMGSERYAPTINNSNSIAAVVNKASVGVSTCELVDVLANPEHSRGRSLMSEPVVTNHKSSSRSKSLLPGEVHIHADLHLLLTLCILRSRPGQDDTKTKSTISTDVTSQPEIPCRLMQCWHVQRTGKSTQTDMHSPITTSLPPTDSCEIIPIYFLITTERICLMSRLPTELDVEWITTHPELVVDEWPVNNIQTVYRGIYGQMLHIRFYEDSSNNSNSHDRVLLLQFGDPSSSMAVGVDLKVILASLQVSAQKCIRGEDSHFDCTPPAVELDHADTVLYAALEGAVAFDRLPYANAADVESIIPAIMTPGVMVRGLQLYLTGQWIDHTARVDMSESPDVVENTHNLRESNLSAGCIEKTNGFEETECNTFEQTGRNSDNVESVVASLAGMKVKSEGLCSLSIEICNLLSIDNSRLRSLQVEHIPWLSGPVLYRGHRFKVVLWKEIGLRIYKNGELQRSDITDTHASTPRYTKIMRSVRYPPGQWISGGRCEFEVVFSDETSHVFAVCSGSEARRWIATALLSIHKLADQSTTEPKPIPDTNRNAVSTSTSPMQNSSGSITITTPISSHGSNCSSASPSHHATNSLSPAPMRTASVDANTVQHGDMDTPYRPIMKFLCDGPCRLFIHEISATASSSTTNIAQVCHFFLFDRMLVVTCNTAGFSTTVPSAGENEVQCVLMLEELFLNSDDSSGTFLLTHRDQCVSVRLPVRFDATLSKIKKQKLSLVAPSRNVRKIVEECVRRQKPMKEPASRPHAIVPPSDLLPLISDDKFITEKCALSCSVLVTDTHLCIARENHFAMQPHMRLNVVKRLPIRDIEVQCVDDLSRQVVVVRESSYQQSCGVREWKNPPTATFHGENIRKSQRATAHGDRVLIKIQLCSDKMSSLLCNVINRVKVSWHN